MHRTETVILLIAALVMIGIAAHFQWLYTKPPGVPMLDVMAIKYVTLLVGMMSFTLACLAKQRAQGLRF